MLEPRTDIHLPKTCRTQTDAKVKQTNQQELHLQSVCQHLQRTATNSIHYSINRSIASAMPSLLLFATTASASLSTCNKSICLSKWNKVSYHKIWQSPGKDLCTSDWSAASATCMRRMSFGHCWLYIVAKRQQVQSCLTTLPFTCIWRHQMLHNLACLLVQIT